MSAYIKLISHKGKKIYYTDWTNLKTNEESIKVANETSDYIISKKEYNLLEIIDVTGSYASMQVLTEVKKIAQKTAEFNKKKAMLGIVGAKKILLNSVNRIAKTNIKAFDTIEEAKDWLVKD